MAAHVGFVVDKVAHGQTFLRLLCFTAIHFDPTNNAMFIRSVSGGLDNRPGHVIDLPGTGRT
jgi:hypothetical protein